MKLKINIVIILSALIFQNCNDQKKVDSFMYDNKPIDAFQFSFQTAHVKAQALMTSEFLWSPIEETAPFGSDDGSDAAYGFRIWTKESKDGNPKKYLDDLIERWNYEKFDYFILDSVLIGKFLSESKKLSEGEIMDRIKQMREIYLKIEDTILSKASDEELRQSIIESSRGMNGSFLLGQDNAIIGIGFAQLALEGKIDFEFKKITEIAISRQLLPIMINRYDNNYIETRKAQLQEMLQIVKKAES